MSETATTTEQPTPGPWEAGVHPANPAMNIVRPIMFGRRMGKLPECEGGHSFIRNRADALLIAAAPDLHDALNKIAAYCDAFATQNSCMPNFLDVLVLAEKALAKAEGREL
jgi:hypothetical protein